MQKDKVKIGEHIQKGVRKSNMELLRIVAMLLVLVIHASFLSANMPTHKDCFESQFSVLTRFSFMSISCICVNVFVLLSGWFGIKLRLRKVMAFLFQVFFFAFLIYAVMFILFPEHRVNPKSIGTLFMLSSSDYWFAKAYLGLMMIAPILNAWIAQASERQILLFLSFFYVFQTIYGWASLYGAQWFEGGYSAFSFIGLYVLARYFRLYGQQRIEKAYYTFTHRKIKAIQYMTAYFVLTALNAFMAFGVTRMGFPVAGRLFTYTQPIVIVESLCLLLFFSKLRFQSTVINKIAVSCFAVYLLHGNELLLRPHYGRLVSEWYVQYNTQTFFVNTVLLIILCFFSAIIIDRIRLSLWKMIVSKLDTKC